MAIMPSRENSVLVALTETEIEGFKINKSVTGFRNPCYKKEIVKQPVEMITWNKKQFVQKWL